MVDALQRNVKQKRDMLKKLADSVVFRQPYDRIYQERMKLDILNRDLKKSMFASLERAGSKLGFLIGKLDALSPLLYY